MKFKIKPHQTLGRGWSRRWRVFPRRCVRCNSFVLWEWLAFNKRHYCSCIGDEHQHEYHCLPCHTTYLLEEKGQP